MSPEHLPVQNPLLKEFIHLFNDRQFFEAHEVLEDLWIATSGPTRDFYKGLIQYAVAFTHLSRRNFKGAKSLYNRGTGYLQRYLPRTEGVELAQLVNDTTVFFQNVVPVMAKTPSMDFRSVETPRIHVKDHQ